MVLSFALCATFAFAQSNKLAVNRMAADKAPVAVENVKAQPAAGYTGSIFTKEGELFLCTFEDNSNLYSTGAIGSNELVNGTNATPHAQQAFHSTWHRLPDSTGNYNENIYGADHYGVTVGHYANYGGWHYFTEEMRSNTPNDGFMVMTMQDQISDWGGTGANGAFDAYIAFAPFSSQGVGLLRVRFYQLYRCFNNDKCWIDYSVDNSTWYAIEVNRARIDVSVNGWAIGWKSASMPSATANQASVYMRLRWECSSNSGGAYGYIWMVDDFSVMPAPMNHFNIVSNEYYEGFYQMMPQNLQVPVVWVSELSNDGQTDQTSVTGHVYTFASGEAATELTNKNIYTMPSEPYDFRKIIIDPLDWYDSVGRPTSSGGVSHGEYGYNYVRTGDPYACLPTTNTGVHHFFTDITANPGFTTHIGDSVTFDTLRYNVNWDAAAEHPYGIWARDHGAVRRNSYYAAGLVGANTFSDQVDFEEGDPLWDKAGYGVFVTYVTGDSIPRDANGNPWKILGMELVPATRLNMAQAGSRFEPQLRYEWTDSAGSGWISKVNVGASTYIVQNNDVYASSELGDNGFEYYTPIDNEYRKIQIMFPNQPELVPNLSFMVGYQLEEDANFAVATSSNFFYRGTQTVAFADEPGMESYGHALTMFNKSTVIMYDPYDNGLHAFNTNSYPMIRMLVGPGYYVPKVAVSLECDNEDLGYFADGQLTNICGEIDSVPVNGAASYIAMPVPGYVVDAIYLDGVALDTIEDGNGNRIAIVEDEEDGLTYAYVYLNNVTTNCTLRCSFKEAPIGFDPVANNVVMKLQPNPASSMVNVALKGVTGNVNMALIDMSGRVVSTSQFDAENGTTINVSNLAKGAYFVRITNSKFNKIEKLIVR